MPAISFGSPEDDYSFPSFTPQINLHFIKLNDDEIEYSEDGFIYSKFNEIKSQIAMQTIDEVCQKLKPMLHQMYQEVTTPRVYDVYLFMYNNKFGGWVNPTSLVNLAITGIKEGYKFITGETE